MIHVFICVDGAFFFSRSSSTDVMGICSGYFFIVFIWCRFHTSCLLFGSVSYVLFFPHYDVAYCYLHNVEASS